VQARSAAVFVLLVVLAACGSDRGGVPKGTPAEVVQGSAPRTAAAGRARVIVDGPDGRHSEGVVDFAAGSGTLAVSAPGVPAVSVTVGATPPALAAVLARPEYTDPGSVIALVRYADNIDPFGGLLVRGVGTVRYDVNLRPPGQRPFYADVYVDSQGRVRRLTVPDDRNDHRVTGTEARLARQITIDVVYQ
jgi:hypothetical protein